MSKKNDNERGGDGGSKTVLNYKLASWTQDLFALCMLAVGCFISFRAFKPANGAHDRFQILILGLGVWIVFMGVRGLFRGGCTIDLQKRTVLKWWGIGLRVRSVTVPLDQIRGVRVTGSKIGKSFAVSRWSTVVLEGPSCVIPVKHIHGWDRAAVFAQALSKEIGIEYWREP